MSFSIRKLFGRESSGGDEGDAHALVERGIAAESAGAPDEAMRYYRQAIGADPKYAPAQMNLGMALQAGGEAAAAIECYRRAIELDPGYAAAHYNLGLARLSGGEHAQAEASLREALRLREEFPEAWVALADALEALGRDEEALAALDTAIGQRDGYVGALLNAGALLRRMGRLPAADARLREVPEDHPEYADALIGRAAVLLAQGRPDTAEASFRRAAELKPDSYGVRNDLGNVLRDLGRLSEAEASYRRALELGPGLHEAHNNLGVALMDLGRSPEAEACFHSALALNPDYHEAHGNLLFVLNYHPDRSAEEIFSAYRAFDARFGLPLRAQWRLHGNDRAPERRLRVGYVSADFCNHSCRYFIEPLLAHHDASQMEVFAYSDVQVEDAVSARMKSQVEHWVPTVAMDDAQLAGRIRMDAIDILVDLAGHTRGNRLLMFARKPAPVSVSTLGFGYTTGLSAIDWFLTDPYAVPEGSEHLFSERPWRLPYCLAYRPAEGMGEEGSLPGLQNGYVTFCTLTRAVRINHRTVRAWSEILRRVPEAKLRFDSGSFRDAELCRSLRRQFAAQGIGEERLEMGFHSPPWDVLRQSDIALDCFPHNSGTTLFESLYMGVPFITLAGRPSVGRLGASILAKAGHPEWIAASEAEYVDKAVALAADLPQLAMARSRLRADSTRIGEVQSVRMVEAAYREMWRRWVTAPLPSE